MRRLIVTTWQPRPERGLPNAYLARLTAGPDGGLRRDRAPRPRKVSGQRREFALEAREGDVFEGCRWWWDAARGDYDGGPFWAVVGGSGMLAPLTRDEALAALRSPRLAADGDRPQPAVTRMPLLHVDLVA